MTTVFINFAPHLGDLFITRGIAEGLMREKGERSISCTYLTDPDIYSHLQSPNLEIRYSKDKKDYDIPVIHGGIDIAKHYIGGNVFQYVYTPTADFLNELHQTFEAQLKDGIFEGVEKIYSLHMQFNVIYLGYYLEKHYGIKAEGYTFQEVEGKFHLVGSVFCKDGILQHFGEILGITPQFKDFVIAPNEPVISNTVLFLTGSRHTDNLSNQYWQLAEDYFTKRGFIVEVGEYGKTYHTLDELIKLINSNRIIVTNDSFPYHVAWSLEKEIILKEKLGVLAEWTHKDEFFDSKGKTYSIPPAPLFEEGYIHHLNQALKFFDL